MTRRSSFRAAGECLDRVFQALAHPVRREMLRRLADDRELNLSDLAAPLEMTFPAASKHVRVLERANLVQRRVVGRSHLCRLDAKPLKEVADWTETYRRAWERSLGLLDDLLEDLKRAEATTDEGPGNNK
ncbi:MAG: helix-turn-helix transcriptional regulator [Phycisphaerales bacterium]|nr:helix-turn-helix transcriptional regulator [Phycisphaerales bacterium]